MVIGRQWRDGRKKTPADQLTRELDALSACAICEKGVVTDTDHSRRKHMQKKPAEELVDVQAEELFGVAMCVVTIAEADALTLERDDAGVTDGDAVGVVGEVSENLLRTAEGRFAVHDPNRWRRPVPGAGRVRPRRR